MSSAPLVAALAGLTLCAAAAAAQPADTIGDGRIEIRPIAHGTLALLHRGHVILIDPARFVPGYPGAPTTDLQALAKAYLAIHGGPPAPTPQDQDPPAELSASAVPVRPGQLARFDGLGPATVILVTHNHTDHLDPRALAALRTPATRIIVPASAAGLLLDVVGAKPMANGDRLDLGDGLTVDAVPMYNPVPDPKLGWPFHPKGDDHVRSGSLREGDAPARRLPVPLLWIGPERLRGRARGQRHRSTAPGLVRRRDATDPLRLSRPPASSSMPRWRGAC
jgi:hypothetical protein